MYNELRQYLIQTVAAGTVPSGNAFLAKAAWEFGSKGFKGQACYTSVVKTRGSGMGFGHARRGFSLPAEMPR